MILLNSFYTITEQNSDIDKVNAIIRIDPSHGIFQGHFPGQPVVPGVCMVQIVKELMEQRTGKKLLFSKGHQLKFLQLLVPVADEAIQVNISWTADEEDRYLTNADFKRNNEAAFKLSGIFQVQ